MATTQEIRSIIESSDLYNHIASGPPVGACFRFSSEAQGILRQAGITSVMVGDQRHYFLLTESSDEGIMMLDLTAHQFNYENGPTEWIFMAIEDAVSHIQGLVDCQIKGNWLHDIPVAKKDFDPIYGVDLMPEEKAFLARVQDAIADTDMTVIYDITKEHSKSVASRIMQDLQVPVSMLPEGHVKEFYEGNGTEYVPLSPLYIHDDSVRAKLADECSSFKADPHKIKNINAVLNSEYCPEAFQGKAVEIYSPSQDTSPRR